MFVTHSIVEAVFLSTRVAGDGGATGPRDRRRRDRRAVSARRRSFACRSPPRITRATLSRLVADSWRRRRAARSTRACNDERPHRRGSRASVAPALGRARRCSALWQWLTTAYDVPAYLVPIAHAGGCARSSPDRELLLRSLGVTLGIALVALAIATLVGALVALLFVQSRWIEMSLFPYAVLLQVTPIVAIAPLIIIWVKDTRIALRALRGRRRDLSDHLQHDAWPAQRRSGSARICSACAAPAAGRS